MSVVVAQLHNLTDPPCLSWFQVGAMFFLCYWRLRQSCLLDIVVILFLCHMLGD